MPIINQNVQVVFGTGDISARIAYSKDFSSGVMEFIQAEPRPIGKEYPIGERKMNIGSAPVTLVFDKIESLDAVIHQLQKLKDIMEGKYEWTEDGRIVGKN